MTATPFAVGTDTAFAIESRTARLLARDDWPLVTLVGTLLVLSSSHLLPAVLLAGYAAAVLRSGVDGDPTLPGFDDLGSLARDGAATAAVVAAYHLPAAVAFAATARYASRRLGPLLTLAEVAHRPVRLLSFGSSVGAATSAPVVASGLLLAAALAVAGGYASAAALLRYARGGSVRAAFDASALRSMVTSAAFLRVWVASVGALFLTRLAAGVVSALPVVGGVAAAAATFAGTCAVFRFAGATAPPASPSRSGAHTRTAVSRPAE